MLLAGLVSCVKDEKGEAFVPDETPDRVTYITGKLLTSKVELSTEGRLAWCVGDEVKIAPLSPPGFDGNSAVFVTPLGDGSFKSADGVVQGATCIAFSPVTVSWNGGAWVCTLPPQMMASPEDESHLNHLLYTSSPFTVEANGEGFTMVARMALLDVNVVSPASGAKLTSFKVTAPQESNFFVRSGLIKVDGTVEGLSFADESILTFSGDGLILKENVPSKLRMGVWYNPSAQFDAKADRLLFTYTLAGGEEVSVKRAIFPYSAGNYYAFSKPDTLRPKDDYPGGYGTSVEIDGVWWAPVNCGYHPTSNTYGLLYQWGRKDGQGYNGEVNAPTIGTGPISATAIPNAGTFYKVSASPYDWLSTRNHRLWNGALGVGEQAVKTELDPCPNGWRVPTQEELGKLASSSRSAVVSAAHGESNNLTGVWIGASAATDPSAEDCIFLPMGGSRTYSGSVASSRGNRGVYYSSSPNGNNAGYLMFDHSSLSVSTAGARAGAMSIRCVKDK